MNAVIYARVSTSKQAKKGVSIPTQVEKGKKVLRENGYAVKQIFVEAKSASDSAEKRPVFQDAIRYSLDKRNKIQGFFVYDSSRFARDRIDAALYKRDLRKRGITILYSGQIVDPENEDDLMMEGLYELLDERIAKRRGKRALEGMIMNAKQGYFNGGAAGVGYQFKKIKVQTPDGITQKLTLVPDPKYAGLIERMYQMVIDGSGVVGIARTLNQEGKKTPKGKKWISTSINRILHNVRYIGHSVFRDQTIENTHPAIIKKETFDKVQEIMKSRAPQIEHNINPRRKVLFSGVLYCGECKHPLVATTARGKNKKTYHYYECHTKRKGTSCLGLRIPALEFDAWLRPVILKCFPDRNILEKMHDDVCVEISAHNKDLSEKGRKLKIQKDGIQTRISKLLNILETSDDFDPADIAPRLKELRDTETDIQNEIDGLVQYSNEVFVPKNKEGTLNMLEGWIRDMLQETSPEHFARFLRKIGMKIYVYKGGRTDIILDDNRVLQQGFIEGINWRAW